MSIAESSLLLINTLIKWIETVADLAESMAYVEQKTKKPIEEVLGEALVPDIIMKLPPDVAKDLLYIMAQMTALSTKINNLPRLETEEKLELSKKLREIANSLKNLVNKINQGGLE